MLFDCQQINFQLEHLLITYLGTLTTVKCTFKRKTKINSFFEAGIRQQFIFTCI